MSHLARQFECGWSSLIYRLFEDVSLRGSPSEVAETSLHGQNPRMHQLGFQSQKNLPFKVEKSPECQRVLEQRMRDNLLHKCPVFDDVSTFNASGMKAAGITAGFPCQASPAPFIPNWHLPRQMCSTILSCSVHGCREPAWPANKPGWATVALLSWSECGLCGTIWTRRRSKLRRALVNTSAQ